MGIQYRAKPSIGAACEGSNDYAYQLLTSFIGHWCPYKYQLAAKMIDLQSIAKGKAQADLQRRVEALPKDIRAIQNELIANGTGAQSGAMLKRVTAACVESMKGYTSVLMTEYKWAIEQSLGASEAWVSNLMVEANDSFNPLLEASIGHIHRAVAIVGGSGNGPNLTERLIGELKAAHSTAQNDVRLALQAASAEKSRGFVRKIPGTVAGFIANIFGGGRS
jgi:hypothetical protein